MKVISLGTYTGRTNILRAQFELLIGLKKKGVDITIMATCSEEILTYFQNATIPVIQDYPETKVDLEYVKRLRKIIVENNFNIVHVFNGKEIRNAVIATKGLPIKLISYMGSVSLHWHDPSAYLTYLSPRNDKIICNSNYVYEHAKKQLIGKSKQKAIRIYKGYDSNWFINTKAFDYSSIGIPKDAIIVCMAANYRKGKVKGIRYFLESSYFLKTDRNVHYIMLGIGYDSPKISNLVANSPIKNNIHLLGARTDAVALIKGADIYVQTSLKEGFGRAISEAMCVGKPIIMTDAGGCTELIDDKSGIVVPVKDSKAIGGAINLLAENDELRVQMGIAAKKRIERVYNIEDTIKETYDLYSSLMK